MFKHRKVAQIAAVFAEKEGGAINLLKLIKLMYLADRQSFARHGLPISFDRYVSMNHGPVLSRTYDLINGDIEGSGGANWREWIGDRESHLVDVRKEFSRNDLDELSDADLEIIEDVWKNFGSMSQWELRDYTHQHCSEWEDPHDSSNPISYKKVFEALGSDSKSATALSEYVERERYLDSLLADD